jgi:clathrin heavy chain
MELAAQSHQAELAEELLRFFVEQGEKECFAACLFTCYELVRPGLAMELAWMHGLMEFAMPFIIQTVNEYTGKVGAALGVGGTGAAWLRAAWRCGGL